MRWAGIPILITGAIIVWVFLPNKKICGVIVHTIDLILLALGLGALALTLVGRVALGAFVPCCLAALAGYVGSYETARWPSGGR